MPYSIIFRNAAANEAAARGLEQDNAALYSILDLPNGSEVKYKDGTNKTIDDAIKAEIRGEIERNNTLIGILTDECFGSVMVGHDPRGRIREPGAGYRAAFVC